MFCNSCGKDIGKAGIKFCPYCGDRTDISQITEAVTAKKDDAPETRNGKSPLNKTAIIVAIIIAVAAVVITVMIISKDSFTNPENDQDNNISVNNESEKPESVDESEELTHESDVPNVGIEPEEVNLESVILGEWTNGGAEWGAEYITTFYPDGTVISEGWRNLDTGTYTIENNTVVADFVDCLGDSPGEGYVKYDFQYSVIYRYKRNTGELSREVFPENPASLDNLGNLTKCDP